METLSPKQREIRNREQRILQLSRTQVLAGGYHGLNLDSLAGDLGVSRGTIYNHFRCKEDIVLALLAETMDIRRGMFSRAASWQALPRERLAAVGVAAEMFVRLYPDHFRVERIVMSDSVWEKTSPERRLLVKSCQLQCVGIVAGVVRDGVAQGHLTLPEGMVPEDLVFGLWSMTEGAYSIISSSDAIGELGIRRPYEAIRSNIHCLLDGFGWVPLSTRHDYQRTASRILTDVFSDEFKKLRQDW